MNTYLVIYEDHDSRPDYRIIEADSNAEADKIAWDESISNHEYVVGNYDIYKIVYTEWLKTHELIPVVLEVD